MKKARIKFIHTAVQRAKAKEVDINCDGYYPVCPTGGSWEVERNRGELWSFCPECGQRMKQPEVVRKESEI